MSDGIALTLIFCFGDKISSRQESKNIAGNITANKMILQEQLA